MLARATAQLTASHELRESAARDAFTLLLHTLNITRTQFYANPDREIAPEQQAAYDAAIARRLKNEPIQYITGEQEFYGLSFRVTPAVLIPRPETEHLVESVLSELISSGNNKDAVIPGEAAQRRSRGTPAFAFRSEKQSRILDIGTGSGAIALALAHHLPHAHITATDISPTALDIARENAARHNLADRIDFIQSDLLDSVRHKGHTREATATREARRERYEVLVSNPPYVPESDRAALHPQVRDYEPATALFAPVISGVDDGLAIYRRLIPQARAALVPKGLLALEIGHGQRDAVAQLLAGWSSVRFVDDLQGIPRVALARNPEPPALKL
ncbi:MAG TPA: peptide chain release factor N(5)-glutamine methyltransferase [Acidobacteriaceae bacterium]|nr:peptide chain release factor N(5)-glutamine methyltransferase [Acidobacteriaceae bacterium]